MSEKTIRRGRRELNSELAERPVGRVREPGGGRPAIEAWDPALADTLAHLLVPETAVTAGAGQVQTQLTAPAQRPLVAKRPSSQSDDGRRLLRKRGYSLRVNARRKEAKASPPERDTQFRHINAQKDDFLAGGEPVIR